MGAHLSTKMSLSEQTQVASVLLNYHPIFSTQSIFIYYFFFFLSYSSVFDQIPCIKAFFCNEISLWTSIQAFCTVDLGGKYLIHHQLWLVIQNQIKKFKKRLSSTYTNVLFLFIPNIILDELTICSSYIRISSIIEVDLFFLRNYETTYMIILIYYKRKCGGGAWQIHETKQLGQTQLHQENVWALLGGQLDATPQSTPQLLRFVQPKTLRRNLRSLFYYIGKIGKYTLESILNYVYKLKPIKLEIQTIITRKSGSPKY